ncbi:hypothetical protein [Edaphocola aurantiacus]|uniref:hypothetical protein n=1 Tax=Edaphocola aurantiacus TaxID=2601682 RepID=UPI001C989153|nr:hypothetical protein [Edaphocola aurantiacus]
MRSRIFWILVIALLLFLGYGLLPVKFPDRKQDYDAPNTLFITNQECGCPCPNARVLKGKLVAADSILLQYPGLIVDAGEIELENFPPYKKPIADYGFIAFNQFKVKGHISGAYAVYCDPGGCKYVPKFTVESWSMTTYYAKFWLFPAWLAICVYYLFVLSAACFDNICAVQVMGAIYVRIAGQAISINCFCTIFRKL